jgi:hypothetical protein
VQGTNSKGIFRISVVPEENKNKLESKWKDFASWLYSVETKSNSKSLNLPPKFEPIDMKKIKINPGSRDLHQPVKMEPSTSNVDTTKIKTPFGMVKPVDKKEIKKESEVKKDKVAEKKDVNKTTPKEEKIKIIEPSKEESMSVAKTSPEVKASASKTSVAAAATSKKGTAKPVAQGKASISSFFNKGSTSQPKPVASTSGTKKIEPKVEVKKEEKEEVSRKRSASPEKAKSSAKKPANKKIKLKNPPNKKRSRIQVIDDSSEEEQEEEPQQVEEPESKFIKFDREFTPEESAIRSPIKEEDSPEKKPEVAKGIKNKAKRWVTKRFETDDGFIRTEKVLEEYSASEDENDENRKKNSPPPPQERKASPPSAKTSPQKKSTKSKPKDNVKGKQGSIMSFFSKK